MTLQQPETLQLSDIRAEIVAARKKRLELLGAGEGIAVPVSRRVPLVPFASGSIVLCEIKRGSPSLGALAPHMDAVEQAALYISRGITSISVLTEPDYFLGSLQDLIRVKEAFPQTTFLRKDFLFSVEDIEISWRAGADSCLLIASLLPTALFTAMYQACKAYGIEPLVEVHTPEDIRKVAPLKPSLLGINSRDLTTFRMKPLLPLSLKGLIDWDCRVIYESGIRQQKDAAFVFDSGFDGVLVGEGVVRNEGLLQQLLETARKSGSARRRLSPFSHLYTRRTLATAGDVQQMHKRRPLIKICGLTRLEDVLLAESLGADMLGFILAESKRRVSAAFIRSLPETEALKVGVVVLQPGESLPADVEALLSDNCLDLIQFHGEESPELVYAYPGYKALRIRSLEDVSASTAYRPRPVLLDAYSPGAAGGTGKSIPEKFTAAAAETGELWLAGGLTPDSVRAVIERFQPDAIDVSSGIELSPGVKSEQAMREFFREAMAHDTV